MEAFHMSVKNDILSILEQNRNEPISGEAIATKLNVSRAYVWKAINKLKEEGYDISASPNLGYILSNSNDMISKEGILPFLHPAYQNNTIYVYKTISSTNTEAKRLALNNAMHGTVVISEEQSAGRGRRGRSFYSPKGLGIYISFVLHLDLSIQDAVLITTAASVAVHRAIKEVTNIDTKIKWVNDLYYQEKKICGILTEAVTNIETGQIDSLVVGIGLNFNLPKESIPDELKEIVGSLYSEKPTNITRNMLCAEIMNQLFDLINDLPKCDFLTDYKKHSMVLGKKIYIINGNQKETATAIDIDSAGGLIVKLDDGTIKTLNTGEISIRPMN